MTTKDSIPATNIELGDLKNDLFRVLNCYEIDASEVTQGITYIDSGEANKISTALLAPIQAHLNQEIKAVLNRLKEQQVVYNAKSTNGKLNKPGDTGRVAVPIEAIEAEEKRLE